LIADLSKKKKDVCVIIVDHKTLSWRA